MKRWSVNIHYHNESVAHLQIEELEELQEIIENGPDFSWIKKIVVTYNFGK